MNIRGFGFITLIVVAVAAFIFGAFFFEKPDFKSLVDFSPAFGDGDGCVEAFACLDGDTKILQKSDCSLGEKVECSGLGFETCNGLNSPAKCCTVTPFCTDSDGGLNYGVVGEISTGANTECEDGGGSGSISLKDKCEDGKTLIEYSCNAGLSESQKFDCPNGCSNGACI